MVLLEVRITPQTFVTVPAGATGTVSVPTTDTLMKWMKTFTLPGTFGYGYNVDNNMRLLWQRSLLRLPKDLMWYSTLLSNPSDRYCVYLCIDKWYCWSADYTTTNVRNRTAGATTGTVSVPTTADKLMK
jgi:hypothetical protein